MRCSETIRNLLTIAGQARGIKYMNFQTFLAQNWQLVGALILFIFHLGFTYGKFQQLQKERETDNIRHSEQREQDYKDFESQLKEQKKDHDEKINNLTTNLALTTSKVDSLKDNVFDLIKDIQIDIKGIMVELKIRSSQK